MDAVATAKLALDASSMNRGLASAQASLGKFSKAATVSGSQAAQAFRNFGSGLSEAKNASDVAASAASSLGRILQKTFAGAVIVGGVKLITDQIERMGEMVKETATSAQKSFDDIEKAGQAMSFENALSQTSSLSQNIEQIRNKLAELERSPFQNFIAGATGAREQLEGLLETQERLRAAKLAEGLASENERNAALQGLSAEEKQLFEINEEYQKRIKQINETMADQPGMAASAKEDAGEIMARKRNEVLDKKAAKAADEQSKIDADLAKKEADYERELFQAEMEAAKFERETKEKLDKEIADQEAEYQKELFQAEMEAAKFERETKEKINKELEEAAKIAKAAPRLIEQAEGGAATETLDFAAGLGDRGISQSVQRERDRASREQQKINRKEFDEKVLSETSATTAEGLTRTMTSRRQEFIKKEAGKEAKGGKTLSDIYEALDKALTELTRAPIVT